MASTRACIKCGESIVFLAKDGGGWVPVDASDVDRDERNFDPDNHRRHECVGDDD